MRSTVLISKWFSASVDSVLFLTHVLCISSSGDDFADKPEEQDDPQPGVAVTHSFANDQEIAHVRS
jgi:hypothetical protein